MPAYLRVSSRGTWLYLAMSDSMDWRTQNSSGSISRRRLAALSG